MTPLTPTQIKILKSIQESYKLAKKNGCGGIDQARCDQVFNNKPKSVKPELWDVARSPIEALKIDKSGGLAAKYLDAAIWAFDLILATDDLESQVCDKMRDLHTRKKQKSNEIDR